jgi:hypothetical protein
MHKGIWVAILAHGLVGVSLLWDKVLPRKPATQNLVSYVFWMGAMSIFGVVLAVFRFRMPLIEGNKAVLAFGAGVGGTRLPK